MFFESIFFFLVLFIYSSVFRIFKNCETKKYFALFFSFACLFFFSPVSLILFLIILTLTYYLLDKLVNNITKVLLICLNAGLLVFYKSLPYLNYHISYFSQTNLQWIVPIGLSYFVFEQIAYIVRFTSTSKLNFVNYLNASLFFPKIISGPISNLTNISFQFEQNIESEDKNFVKAWLFIFWGLFKKYVLGNRLVMISELVLNSNSLTGIQFFIAVLFLKYEIWVNFSAYMDIVRGSSLLFGIKLPENFNRPFYATNIRDFWKRWHMSLTEWIKTFIFFPLLTTRLANLGLVFLTFVTFLIFGLWHGFKLTYVVYAIIQTALIYTSYKIEKFKFPLINKINTRVLNFINSLFTYTILISLPTIIFRANDLTHAVKLFEKLLIISDQKLVDLVSIYPILALIILVEYLEHFNGLNLIHDKIKKQKLFKIFLFFLFIIFCIILFGNFEVSNILLYSQF